MNVFSYVLERDSVDSEPGLSPEKFVIEDNIGESVHIHLRNVRIEMSIEEFDRFADNVEQAVKGIDDGNC